MNTRLLLTAFLLALAVLHPRTTANPLDFPALDVRFDPEKRVTFLQWNPRKLPIELSFSPDLEKWTPWPVQPEGPTNRTVTVEAGEPHAFFRLDPTVAPDKPRGLTADPLHDGLSLHWEPDPLATTYSLYVGETPDVGPEKHLKAIHGLGGNDFILEGFPADKVLYFSVLGVNSRGSSPPSSGLRKAFAGTGRVSGNLGVASQDADGAPFVKSLAGHAVRLLLAPDNLEVDRSTTGAGGRFEFADVPPGSYRIAWDGDALVFDGATKDTFQVDQGLRPLGDLLADARPGFISGRTHFRGGIPAVFTDRVFGIDHRAVVTAFNLKGTPVGVTEVDDDGAFAFAGFPPEDYPITFTAEFRGSQATAKIPSPQAPGPAQLVFGVDPPRVVSAVPVQDEVRIPIVDCRRPFRIETRIDGPEQQAVSIRWAAFTPAGRVLGVSDGVQPTFKFSVDQETVLHFHGVVEAPGAVPTTIDFRVPFTCGAFSRFTGRVAVWNEVASESLEPVAGAIVRARVGGALRTAVSDADGSFELAAVPNIGPMVLSIEKPGFMPWSWRFEGRPSEKEYGLVRASTNTATIPAAGQPPVTVGFLRYGLILPPRCFTAGGVPYSGPIVIEEAYVGLGKFALQPFPADPLRNLGGILDAADPSEYQWLAVRGAGGEVLTPVEGEGGPKILYRKPVEGARRLFRKDGQQGIFEFAGSSDGESAPPFRVYTFPLSHAASVWMTELVYNLDDSQVQISADRSLNYPFDVLVNNSAFPVTVHGPGQHDTGPIRLRTYYPFTEPRYRVLDQRQAPGVFYADLTSLKPRAAFRKPVVVDLQPGPASNIVSTIAVRLGLGRTLPELAPAPATTGYGSTPAAVPPWRVESLESANAFLAPNPAYASTASPHHDHVAETYYAAIRAPGTLDHWKARNGFPLDPTAVPADGTFVTAYYYNMGDLGFARRLTMRKTTGPDGRPNIAMAVTNFRNLEEARDDIAPIATVCMEYSRTSPVEPQRFVKFTAYDEAGRLANEISLDGGPARPMPNLCVVCHGGRPFDPVTRNPNLGSSFLPFDVESFTFHPRLGAQKTVFAHLNQGVLDTEPAPAIRQLIAGWYGNPNPTAAPGRFEAGFVPDEWNAPAEAPELYHDTFRTSCRICHISRPEGIQFDSYARFALFNGGIQRQVCLVSGGMPATQRTWSIFWGGRAARKLEAASGLPQRSVDYPAQSLGRPPLANLNDLLRRR